MSTYGTRLASVGEIRQDWYSALCEQLRETPSLHRKQWEFVAIPKAVADYRGLHGTGLGFGVGTEPLPAYFASHGCTIVATDQPLTPEAKAAWGATSQLCDGKAALNTRGVCEAGEFDRRVKFRHVDMRDVPADLTGFDFCWSSCAMEHLGGLEAGFRFLWRSLECLVPGGLAVHTTEFNVSSNAGTLEAKNLCLYRLRDIEGLAAGLRAKGHELIDVNLKPPTLPEDMLVATSPNALPHIRYRVGPHVTTSAILVVRKGQ